MSETQKKAARPKNIISESDLSGSKKNRKNLADGFVMSKRMVGGCFVVSVLSLSVALFNSVILLKVAQPESETIAATINDNSELVVGNILNMTPTIRQTENFTQDCMDIVYRASSANFRSKHDNLKSCFYPVFLENNRPVFERDFIANFTNNSLSGEIQPFLNKATVVGSAKTSEEVCVNRMATASVANGIIGCYKLEVDMTLRFLFYGVNTFDDVKKKFVLHLDIVSRDVNPNGLVIYRLREINE